MSKAIQPTGISLYVDDSLQSRHAINLLTSTGLAFDMTLASGHNIPCATLGINGISFSGLHGIENLVKALAPSAYDSWLRERRQEQQTR